MDLKALKDNIKALLILTKPVVNKLIEEKVVPAAKAFMYSSLQKKKDRVVNSLLKLLEKYKTETNEDKKAAHKIGLELGIDAIDTIGKGLMDAAATLREALQ